MKFVNYLKSIDHIAIYPIIGLVLFTSLFIFITLYVWRSDKKEMQEKGEIPLH